MSEIVLPHMNFGDVIQMSGYTA